MDRLLARLERKLGRWAIHNLTWYIVGLGAVVFVLAWRLFLPLAGAMRLGLLLFQGGEFAFVLFALAGREKLVSPLLQQELTIVVVLSMIATPFLAMLGRRLAPGIPRSS